MIGTVPVFRIHYNPLETQYQSSVFSIVNYTPCSSPPYTLQFTIEPVPVIRIRYSPLQTKLQSLYSTVHNKPKKVREKFLGVPQSHTAALPRRQEEEKTDKTKQVQIEQTYEKH